MPHPLIEQFNNETEWKDKCLLLELIHIKFRQTSGRKGLRQWRIKDTARLLKLSVGLVSEDLQLARAIANELLDPTIKSRNQAIKELRRRQ
jgi:hypothetical protein